jgi:GTP-dependent phosphoenolpyruvate carboxykinase
MEINMVAEQKVKGPVSYFPSIEKKYGQPIEHWIKLVQKQKDMKHMEVVNWLKNEHGLGHGHGHTNAIVAYCFAQKSA